MKSFYVPPIVFVDRAGNSILMTFEDDETISLPALLLHATTGIAKAVNEEEVRNEFCNSDQLGFRKVASSLAA